MLLVALWGAHFDELAIFHMIEVLDWLSTVKKCLLRFPGDGYILCIFANDSCFLLAVRVLNGHRRDVWGFGLRAAVDVL